MQEYLKDLLLTFYYKFDDVMINAEKPLDDDVIKNLVVITIVAMANYRPNTEILFCKASNQRFCCSEDIGWGSSRPSPGL